ncbi:MAG TPA: metallophosphoesterase family protein [Bacteroidota bacterium]|nr:metallophosphoesterase family protein [Bacteroidota bacterium]
MRFAIISDIHANQEALEAVAASIRVQAPDAVVCLGDIVGYGARPNDCIDVVRTLTPHVLLGNHDEAAIDLGRAEYFNPYARIAAEWTHDELTEEHKTFIQALPYSLALGGILFVHSSPRDPAEWNYIITDADAQENFPAFTEPVCFVGHSHLPGIFSADLSEGPVRRGMQFIINVGSVGQPRDNDPRSSYGIFDTNHWEYRNIRVEYNIDAAAAKIRKAGLPKPLADRLFAGR